MQKYYILLVAALLFNLPKSKASLLKDSVGVENVGGKKIILHKVVAKDTYYSIGRRYNISPKIIIAYNDNKYLSLDVIIKVPTDLAFASAKPNNAAQIATQDSGTPAPAGTIIEHAVKPKENLNRLAETYGTTVNEIKRINELKTINLRIGQILKIPVKEGFTETDGNAVQAPVAVPVKEVAVPVKEKVVEKPVERPVEKKAVEKPAPTPVKAEQDADFIEHVVGSNETIYSIATRYNLTMDQLKAKNNLKDNSLSVGQHLLIKGQYPAKPVYIPPAANTADSNKSNSDTTGLKNPSLRYAPSRYGLNQMDEKGAAVWITDPDLDPTKMLVLHRTAPIGSVMKITNPMTNRSTFAKVVGKFTENETTKDVIVVMTKAVADALGAIDKRFFCNLTYSGQQENEQ